MNPITLILEELATCLCSQILTDELPPVCVCGVMPGAEVALDYSGDCDQACGMAWVRLALAYPSTTIGVASSTPGNCASSIGIEVELGIVRCIEVGGSDGSPPTPTQLEVASQLQAGDLMAMWRAVMCCRRSKDYMLGQYAPYGPEGGMVGGVLPVSILVL